MTSVDSIIKSGKVPSILLIFGEEEFLIEEAVAKLTKFLCPTELSLYDYDLLDGEDTSQMVIAGKAQSYPMASERRVIVVKRFEKLFSGKSKKPEKNSPLAAYFNNPSPMTVLVLAAQTDTLAGISNSIKSIKLDNSDKQIEKAKFPYNVLLSKYEWIEFPKIYESNYPTWMNQRIKSFGKTIDPEALALLLAQTPPSLRDINNEIDKIVLYLQDRKNITLNDVTNIAGSSRAFNVFELQNAIGLKDLNKSLKILYNMLDGERQEMLIITMLTRYFLAIWKLQEEFQKTQGPALAGKIGVSPYFLKDYQAAAKKYNPAQINNAIISLCNTDLELKSSGSDNLLSMQSLITNIIEN